MTKQKSTPEPEKAHDLLVTAAKAIGTAAGTVAATVGVGRSASGKFPKSGKSRLPRREKKALRAKSA